MFSFRRDPTMPAPADALVGRADAVDVPPRHTVLGGPITPPWPAGVATAVFGLGCFWGAEQRFWQTPGVVSTAAGYAGGYTPNPSYGEVCSGKTGHAEVVLVAYDPAQLSYEALLRVFWEAHDPTQRMRQGNDIGTQYRSVVLVGSDAERATAEASRRAYAASLAKAGYGPIATEIAPAGPFYYAEDYHQQYLDKNPGGYCPDHGTGVACPIGLGVGANGTTEATVQPVPAGSVDRLG